MPYRIRVLPLVLLFGCAVPPCAAADDPPVEDRAKLAERLRRMPEDLVRCRAPDAEIANKLFLATVRRLPTADEMERISVHFRSSKDRLTATREIVWALLNTREFKLKQEFATAE